MLCVPVDVNLFLKWLIKVLKSLFVALICSIVGWIKNSFAWTLVNDSIASLHISIDPEILDLNS